MPGCPWILVLAAIASAPNAGDAPGASAPRHAAEAADGVRADGAAEKITDAQRDWWAFRPLSDAAPPSIGDPWCRTPIDRFVLERLRAIGLSPNGTADARTLIRRVYLDLVGIPPPVDVVERFAASPSTAHYERIVDDLLASPQHGERWARHWLDVARFAESHGFEHDYDRPHAYHYRDFVIRALADDMPFDRFVQWQLAGDELAPEDPLALMATGFLGAGVFPTQITKNEVERTRYDALDDMAATTGSAFLGLTVGCARCHDHKFDPIPTHDYYRLVATFTTTVRSEIDVPLDPDEHRRALAVFEAAHEGVVRERDAYERAGLAAGFSRWFAASGASVTSGPTWLPLEILESRSDGGATLTKLDDGSIVASGTNPRFDRYVLVASTKTPASEITALRLEALTDPSFVRGGPGRASNGNFGLGSLEVLASPLAAGGGVDPVAIGLTDPVATFQQNTGNLSIAASIDGDKRTGWAVDPQFGKDHAAVFQTIPDEAFRVGFDDGTRFEIRLKFDINDQHAIGKLRLSISTKPRPVGLDGSSLPEDIASLLERVIAVRRAGDGAAPIDALDDVERVRLLGWYRHLDARWLELDGRVREHLAKKPAPRTVKVQVTSEGFEPMRHHTQGADFFDKTYFLERGDTEQKRDVVAPGYLRVLMRGGDDETRWHEAPPDGWRTSYRRRSLAGWITDAEHGAGRLLARVIVNRLWQHHLGRGIVATPNDFGTQGERPTHPELLDWLARQLIESGWRLRPIHRLIVTSAVYTQSADFDGARDRVDPLGKWHWRRTPRRLEAEAIRDSMLFVSGSLDPTMFGPGTLDESMMRRSIYFTVKRSRLIPTLQLFDAPEPLVSIGERPTTTIAPQALLLMNSPHVRRYATSFAERLAGLAASSRASAVVVGYLSALSRPPSESELERTIAFVGAQERRHRDDGNEDALNLALADFCQVLWSLNEFIYVR